MSIRLEIDLDLCTLRLTPSAALSASFVPQECIPHSWETFTPLFASRECRRALTGDYFPFSLLKGYPGSWKTQRTEAVPVRGVMIPLTVSIRRICAGSSAGRPECRRKSSEREKRTRPNDFIRHFKRFSVTLKFEYTHRIWEKS